MTIFGSDEIERQNNPSGAKPAEHRSFALTKPAKQESAPPLPAGPGKPLTTGDLVLNAIIIVLFALEVAAFFAYAACAVVLSFAGGIGIPFLIGAVIPYLYLHFVYVTWQGARKEGTSLVAPLFLALIPAVFLLPVIFQAIFPRGY